MTSVDTVEAIACYDLQIANPGTNPWDLASYNLSIFYDARAACYRSDQLIAPSNVYRSNVRNQFIGSGAITNSGLTFEDSLGFLRISLTFVDGGIGLTVDTSETWLSTINVCFDIKFENITASNTCVEMHFSDDMIERAITAAGGNSVANIVQRWISNDMTEDIGINILKDVLPDASRNSCFVLAEDTEDLCTDGIDNDEDGLIDCMDTECAPGEVVVQPSSIECFDPLGSIAILGGNGDLRYSIDGGMTFGTDSLFTNLSANLYDIVVRKNGIVACSFANPIVLEAPDCNEADEISCMDNIDNDGDGLIDCEDDSCLPKIDTVLTFPPVSCPLLNDGMMDISSLFPNVEYSIDSGRTYLADPIFTELVEGEYYVFIRNINTLCEMAYAYNPVRMIAVDTCVIPDEICDDGFDNDLDGLVDCSDEDCMSLPICFNVPELFIPNIMRAGGRTNNIFNLRSPEPLDLQSLSIFDRWGNQLYHQENLDTLDETEGWDGTTNNQFVSNGVYIYRAVLNVDGTIVYRVGDITVVN